MKSFFIKHLKLLGFVFVCFIVVIGLLVLLPKTKENYCYINYSSSSTNDNDIYDYQMVNLRELKISLKEYKNNEITNVYPMGHVSYAKGKQDKGTLSFQYQFNDDNHQIITMRLKTKHFNTSGDHKVYYSDIDLSQYQKEILAQTIETNQFKETECIKYTDKENEESYYLLVIETIFEESY